MKVARYPRGLAAAALLLLLAAAWAAAFPAGAAAHAVLESTAPAADSSVATAPQHIVLTFSEDPDVALSLIRVLDVNGKTVPGISGPESVPGDPLSLQVTPSSQLAGGVYTVNWRVVSAVDGHVESGAFAFGIGETPAPGSAVVVELLHQSTWARTLAVIGRWLLYGSLALLIGAASTSLFVYGGRLPAGGVTVLRFAAAVAVVALGLVVWAEKALVGAPSLLPLFLTRQGELLLALGVAVLLCIGAVVAADLWPARWSLWLLGAAGAAAVLVHVAAGPAASPWAVWVVNIAVQWVHMTAIGVWVGGLFWLLLGFRGREHAERAAAVGVFTRIATVTLVVVLATGLARAAGEVGSVDALLHTTYGTTLLLKVGLVAALVALGALNHFFWVPAVRGEGGPKAERRFGLNSRGELAVALGVLAATAVLSGLAPARSALAAESSPGASTTPSSRPATQVTATGSDYATTVRVGLTVTPGAAGRNAYQLRAVGYDSGQPLSTVTAVRMECSQPARPGLAPVTITLRRAGDGSWTGDGLEFSVAGPWKVNVYVQETSSGVVVPLELTIAGSGTP